jgi:hypothetical protein
MQLEETALVTEVTVADDGAAPAEVLAGPAESTEGLPQIPLP